MFLNRNIITAVDIGTSKICVMAGVPDKHGNISIIGHGEAPSEGSVVKGEIISFGTAMEALAKAFDEASNAADEEVHRHRMYVGVSASGIVSSQHTGTIVNQDDDRKIKPEHVQDALRNAQGYATASDELAINSCDSYFVVDSVRRVKNPVDQIGSRLDAYIHVISGNRNRIQNFKSLLHEVGVEGEPIPVFTGLASAFGILTDEEKDNGVMLIEMGAGVTEYMAVFDSGILHSGVIPVGFEHVANDLAVGLDLNISVCRKILLDRKYQSLAKEGKAFLELGGTPVRKVPVISIEKIVDLRFREIFNIIKGEFEAKGFFRNTGASLVFSGGAALFPPAVDILKEVFNVPVRVGVPLDLRGSVSEIDSPRYSTAWGLLKYGYLDWQVAEASERKGILERFISGLDGMSKPLFKNITSLKSSIKI